MKNIRPGVAWLLLILFFASCRQINSVFINESPRESYKKKIRDSPLAPKPIAKEWLASGDSVLQHAVAINLPLQTKMVYFIDEGNAWAWQFSVSAGRTIRAHLNRSDTTQQVFMDLFSAVNGKKRLEKSAKYSVITYQADESKPLILRIQAELLVDGSATLTVTSEPSMAFPVQGGSHADIGGVFGDPRDGGARKHKGVDIFADRGTPALAVANGRVSRTGNHGRGGKQVWLRANGKSIYYAHLDSIKADAGQKAEVGDTLGFVGNTGNARTSPPHLHFGIYDRGAINPQPFIDFADNRLNPITADPSRFPKWGRISAARANVRPLPSNKKSPIKSLRRGNAVQITGATGEWYTIILPDKIRGFIYRTLIEPAAKPLRKKQVQFDELFSGFENKVAAFSTDSSQSFPIYGTYQNRGLSKFQDHWVWVAIND